jgi:hypothetical protein
MPRGRPRSIEVVESEGQRVVVAVYADGEVVRKPIDPNVAPRRKPRKPYARAWSDAKDKTRKKQI